MIKYGPDLRNLNSPYSSHDFYEMGLTHDCEVIEHRLNHWDELYAEYKRLKENYERETSVGDWFWFDDGQLGDGG